MKTDDHKLVRNTPKEYEKDPKATRRKKECNKTKSAPPRRPRAHGPRRPRAHGLHRELALEHPVRTGMYRAHGTPVSTGLTNPMRRGSCVRSLDTPCARAPLTPCTRGPLCDAAGFALVLPFRPHLSLSLPRTIYTPSSPPFRLSKGYVRHMRALLHGSTPLGDQDLLLE